MRCPKCGGIPQFWALDVDKVPIYRCPIVLTSRGVDGSYGDFTECNSFIRKGIDVSGQSFVLSGSGIRVAKCE